MITPTQARTIEHPDFRVKDQLASGGMGAVLEAEEATTLRPVALKVMHPAAMQSKGARLRFLQEARVLGRLEHPNIVPIHVLKRDADGKPFYTMKKVQGRDLKQIIEDIRSGDRGTAKQFPLARLLQILQRVCDAISYAHSKGIIHRDLKPANIMVGEFGEVLVMDWGLAKFIGEEDIQRSSSGKSSGQRDSSLSGSLTMEGSTVGTPQFMAPEQAEGRLKDIDERTDTWALGGILYSVLTLFPPFLGNSATEVLRDVRQGRFPSATCFNSAGTLPPAAEARRGFKLIHCPGHRIPAALAAITRKALTVDTEERYASAGDLREDIEAYQNGFATKAEKAGLFKQLGLLIWRNKLITLGLICVLALAVGFGIRVNESAQRREVALSELRASIPLLAADVEELLSAGDLDSAFDRLDHCIKLLPNDASFHFKKGLLFQSAQDFDQAIASFERAVELDSKYPEAAEELEFTRQLQDSKTADGDRFEILSDHLIDAKRFAELSALSLARERAKETRKARFNRWKQQLKDRGVPAQVTANLRREGDELSLEVSDEKLTSIEFLKGIPLTSVRIEAEKLVRLDPLVGMPLTSIHLNTPAVVDLSPLKNMKLRAVTLRKSRARSFEVLSGMPIEFIAITSTTIRDVDFLGESVVTQAVFRKCSRLTDLSSLQGKPIRELDISGTGLKDLKFAKDLPLRHLDMSDTEISDLSPLEGIPLEELNLRESKVKDLSPLKGAPIRSLRIAATKISDLSPLSDARLRFLEIWGSRVTDLSPLANQPLHTLSASGAKIRDLRPLSGTPIHTLMVQGCSELKSLVGLESCNELENLAISNSKLNLDPIRRLPKLKKLSFGPPPNFNWAKVRPVDEYWPVYDKWRRTRKL